MSIAHSSTRPSLCSSRLVAPAAGAGGAPPGVHDATAGLKLNEDAAGFSPPVFLGCLSMSSHVSAITCPRNSSSPSPCCSRLLLCVCLLAGGYAKCSVARQPCPEDHTRAPSQSSNQSTRQSSASRPVPHVPPAAVGFKGK